MARRLLGLAPALALAGLALSAPGAFAQAPDIAGGTATVVDGQDMTTYALEASSGPLGDGAAGQITRVFTGPGGNSTVVANVTCVAAVENRAIVIGAILPELTDAILIRIFDGTPELQPDAVMTAFNPQVGSEVTFTNCEAFLPPFPFVTQPISLGDFQVIDGGEAEPPPPPPPPPCEDDDDDDDCGEDDD